jgi:hypothetical protein
MGTVARALTPYEREHIRICRPRSLAFHDSQKAIGYIIGQLGTTCDVRQVFDLESFFRAPSCPDASALPYLVRTPGKARRQSVQVSLPRPLAAFSFQYCRWSSGLMQARYSYFYATPNCVPRIIATTRPISISSSTRLLISSFTPTNGYFPGWAQLG